MGMFDFIKDAGARILGKDHDAKADVTKPLSQHLRENGIDPTNIRFRFEPVGTVEMTGTVKDQETREKAVVVVGNVQGVERVNDQLRVAASGADFSNVTSHTDTVADTGDPGWKSTTYTVESGDSLSRIAKEVYGDASEYPRIFEANQPMLKDPDKIYPGQVLRIPPKD